MKTKSKAIPFVLALAAQSSARSYLRFTLLGANRAPVSLLRGDSILQRADLREATSETPKPLAN
jgi:hypothetical protein